MVALYLRGFMENLNLELAIERVVETIKKYYNQTTGAKKNK